MLNLTRIRDSFPVLKESTYLNTASVGLSWAGEGEAAAEFYSTKAQGTAARSAWGAKAESTKRELASLLRVTPSQIEFLGSTTEALNLIALSMPLERGDRIVLAEDEFPSVVLPWRCQPELELVRVPVPREEERTRSLCESLDSRTRVLAVSHVHWRTGTRVDLKRLSDACRSYNCRLIVDGVQAVGALAVQAGEVDAYCASVFKWLLSGFGLGFIVLSERLASELSPRVRGYANDLPSRALRYGHLNYPGIFALHATLAYLKALGWQRIFDRVDALAQRSIESLGNAGFEVLTPCNAHGGIVSVRHAAAAAVVRSLANQGIVVEAADHLVRASAHFYNTEDDIQRFTRALAAWRPAARARSKARGARPAG